MAVISYLLTLLLLKQRQDWRWGITEPLSTGVASLITVLSLALGGGAPLSVFRAVSVGFDAVLTCCSLEGGLKEEEPEQPGVYVVMTCFEHMLMSL